MFLLHGRELIEPQDSKDGIDCLDNTRNIAEDLADGERDKCSAYTDSTGDY